MLPLSYAIRNLWRRKARTLVTIVGVALITVLVVLMSGFALGLAETTRESASDDVVLLTATDESQDMVRSAVDLSGARTMATNLPHVAKVGDRRAVGLELHVASRKGDQVGLLRGIEPEAFLVHRRVTVVEGREPTGPMEVVVGRLAESRLGQPKGAFAVGSTIELEGTPWRVVGRFAAPGTVLEAEVWGRLQDVMTAGRRTDVSCVVARLEDASAYEAVESYVAQAGVSAKVTLTTENRLYTSLAGVLAPITKLAWVMAVLVLVAGIFACTNTMFAAVLARTRETGTLRAIGFGPFAVGASLLQEALLLGAIGGLVGYYVAGMFGEVPLKFPMGAFYLDLSPAVRFAGLGAALLAGFLGGIVPAWRTLRLSLPDALGDKL